MRAGASRGCECECECECEPAHHEAVGVRRTAVGVGCMDEEGQAVIRPLLEHHEGPVREGRRAAGCGHQQERRRSARASGGTRLQEIRTSTDKRSCNFDMHIIRRSERGWFCAAIGLGVGACRAKKIERERGTCKKHTHTAPDTAMRGIVFEKNMCMCSCVCASFDGSLNKSPPMTHRRHK